MRLTREVALVGGGAFGFDLSGSLDCHVYLLDGGDELALVDAGMGDDVSVREIVANLQADGFDPGRVRRLLVTHYHLDHMGGAAALAEALGAEIWASPLAARALRDGDEQLISLDVAKRAGFYPPDQHLRRGTVARELAEGDRFHVGALAVEVYETNGHSRGHLSYLVHGRERRYLFVGDLVFHGGTVVLQNIWDCSIQELAASMVKMAGVEFDALLPGHWTISLRNGRRHVEAAARQCQQLFVPKNAF